MKYPQRLIQTGLQRRQEKYVNRLKKNKTKQSLPEVQKKKNGKFPKTSEETRNSLTYRQSTWSLISKLA